MGDFGATVDDDDDTALLETLALAVMAFLYEGGFAILEVLQSTRKHHSLRGDRRTHALLVDAATGGRAHLCEYAVMFVSSD